MWRPEDNIRSPTTVGGGGRSLCMVPRTFTRGQLLGVGYLLLLWGRGRSLCMVHGTQDLYQSGQPNKICNFNILTFHFIKWKNWIKHEIFIK